MNIEYVKKILTDTESSWEGDNVLNGVKVIEKYTDNVFIAAKKDLIYCGYIQECIDSGITEEDLIVLGKNNWSVCEYDSTFSTFV